MEQGKVESNKEVIMVSNLGNLETGSVEQIVSQMGYDNSVRREGVLEEPLMLSGHNEIFTIHANPEKTAEIVDRLKIMVSDMNSEKWRDENSLEAVVERLKENLSYNSSPAISYLKVGKEDVKTLVRYLELM